MKETKTTLVEWQPTILATLKSIKGWGIYGRLYLEDYKGESVLIRRHNLSDAEANKLLHIPGFYNLNSCGPHMMFNKFVECDRTIYKTLVQQHKQAVLKANKMKEKEWETV